MNKKFFSIIITTVLLQKIVLADVQELSIKVGGMVCTACVTPMQNLLKKVDGVTQTPDVNLKNGIVKIKIEEENSDSLNTLHKRLVNAIKKSTYHLEDFDEIIVTGTIEKDRTGYYFLVSKTDDRIHFKKKALNKFLKQIKKIHQKKSDAQLKANVIHHDKKFVITKILQLQ